MCLTPFVKQNNQQIGKTQCFPCGKCIDCKARRVSAWSFRLTEEEKKSETSYFITLTYDTTQSHITKAGFLTLYKRDVQLFFKRLRKKHAASPHTNCGVIKYFAVGEYGNKTRRPHYHVIIFNVKLELMLSYQDQLVLKYSDYDGKIPVKCEQWDHGHVTVGKVTGASVGYSLKYISKKKTVPLHRNDDRQPEFSLMSKRLGMSYLTEEIILWHKADVENRIYLNIAGGKKASMPRYYKQKIYSDEEKEKITDHYRKVQDPWIKDFLLLSPEDRILFYRNRSENIKRSFEVMEFKASINHNKI